MPSRLLLPVLAGLLCLACQSAAAAPAPTGGHAAAAASAPAAPPPARAAKPSVHYAGGDGSSIEQAVVIQGVSGEMAGVGAEYAWLRMKFPGYKPRLQTLLQRAGKIYDVLEIDLPDGKTATVYFDITAFFGKL